jgi:hypothetical protein
MNGRFIKALEKQWNILTRQVIFKERMRKLAAHTIIFWGNGNSSVIRFIYKQKIIIKGKWAQP